MHVRMHVHTTVQPRQSLAANCISRAVQRAEASGGTHLQPDANRVERLCGEDANCSSGGARDKLNNYLVHGAVGPHDGSRKGDTGTEPKP